ncbi:MAG: FKBP-type peptidyl-prolyl cis-trans isomerase [Flavobacteriales bacterium]
MKKIIGFIGLSALVLASCDNKPKSMAVGFESLSNQADSVSYFIGWDIAKNFKGNKIDRLFSPAAFNKGLEDGFAKADLILTKELGNSMIMDNLTAIRNDTSSFTFTPTSVNGFKTLGSKEDSISYFLGSDISGGLTSNGFDKHFSKDAFFKGMEDHFMGATPVLNEQDGEKVAMAVMELEKDNIMAAQRDKFKPQIEAGENFLKEKSAMEDVVTLPSGLMYKIIKEGNGAKPAATDVVSTHYHGTLIDGTVFDSSVERGEPTEFPVNRVIPGWTEALQLMPVGSKWQLYIPYQLAYGEQGTRGIDPYSPLVFDVELLKILSEEEKMEMQRKQMEQQQMQQQIQQQMQQQQMNQ